MVFINVLNCDDGLRKSRKVDFLAFFHRIACAFGILITVYYLLMCVFSFADALDDMRKFGGLGFSYSFSHYLAKNSFPEAIRMSLPVTAEFVLYLVLCCRAERMKCTKVSIWYFSVLLVSHAVIWLHANSLDFPKSPPYITADGVNMRYYIFASITTLQSIVYFILYLLRVRKLRVEIDT